MIDYSKNIKTKKREAIFILIFVFFFLLIGVYFNLFFSVIALTFGTLIFVSFKFRKFPFFILHYINPFLILHFQSFLFWKLLTKQTINIELSEKYLIVGIIAFFVVNIFYIAFGKFDINKFDIKNIINKKIFLIIKYVSLGALLFYLYFISSSNLFEDKRAIKDFLLQNTIFSYIYALSNFFLICVFYELLLFRNNNKKFFWLITIYGIIFLFVFLILGERDLLFSFGIAILFVVFVRSEKFRILPYYLFVTALIFAGPYSQLFKSALLKNSQTVDLNEIGFLNNGFDDFMTSGLNMERVYYLNDLKPVDRQMILSDIGNVIDITQNSGNWYNRVFLGRQIGTTGYGFSLPLTGYMDFGYFGVVFVYLIVSFIIILISKRLSHNLIGLGMIIFMISLISYAQRQDLAYILNFVVKFILIPYFLLTSKVFVKEDSYSN
ncbi:O-antigen polymerase [Patiriisocius hiemis]|uniref:O-antigen polymerase n=1 Tax=Patiriisocius hiemis TaxID=3075604 RepID=A0ABU2YEM6_9FLAO|nr:O-antigen polymerase [Constantimarinum sp. W242]MDT0556641.1 O-antigen polymerase [Constantimarinum sp. W242]